MHAVPGAADDARVGCPHLAAEQQGSPRAAHGHGAERRCIVTRGHARRRLLALRHHHRGAAVRGRAQPGHVRDVIGHHQQRRVSTAKHRLLVLERDKPAGVRRGVAADHRRLVQPPLRGVGDGRIGQDVPGRKVPVRRRCLVTLDAEAAAARIAGPLGPVARPAEAQRQLTLVLIKAELVRARPVLIEAHHQLPRIPLGARVVAAHAVQRAGVPPDPVLKRVALGPARQPAVRLAGVVIDEQGDIAPAATLARGHQGLHGAEPAVSRPVVAAHVLAEGHQAPAPPAGRLARLRRLQGLVVALRLREIAHPLPGDPAVRRDDQGERIERLHQPGACVRDDLQFQGLLRLFVVPITEPAHLLVALAGSSTARVGQVLAPKALKPHLRVSRHPLGGGGVTAELREGSWL